MSFPQNKTNDEYESLFGKSENRIRFIQGEFYSLFTLYQGEKFYFHSVVNIMLLLFQRPMAVAGFLRKKEHGRLHAIWHSVFDPEFAEAFKKCVSNDCKSIDKIRDSKHLVQIPDTGFFIGLYDFTETSFSPTSDSGYDSPPSLLHRLINRMKNDQHAVKVIGTPKMLFEGTYKDIKEKLRLKRPQYLSSFCPPNVREDDIADYIGQISTKLIGEEVYSYVKDSLLLTRYFYPALDDGLHGGVQRPFPNIFFILRTGSNVKRCGYFRSSLRYIFLDDQVDQIVRLMRKHHDSRSGWDNMSSVLSGRCPHYDHKNNLCSIPDMGKCIHDDIFSSAHQWTEKQWNKKTFTILTSPLGSCVRMISDTPLCSGVIEFTDEHEAIGSGRLRVDNNNKKDMDRIRLISCLEHQIHKNPRAVLYPIMLSGTPWITIAMVLPGDDSAEYSADVHGDTHQEHKCTDHQDLKNPIETVPPTTWMTTYHFVHSFLNCKVKDRLRFHAKDICLDLLVKSFITIHRNHYDYDESRYDEFSDMIDKINKKFVQIASVFPFPLLQFGNPPMDGPTKGLFKFLPEFGDSPCYLMENPYFHRVVTVREFLKLETITRKLGNALDTENALLQSEFGDIYQRHFDEFNRSH